MQHRTTQATIHKSKGESKRLTIGNSAEERGDILQRMQTSGELHSDLHEVSERDTVRGGNSENTLQRVRAIMKA